MNSEEGRSRPAWGYQALVSLPARTSTPTRELGRRALFALGLLVITVGLVYFDRGAYQDNNADHVVSLVDAIYYATVTITTTGYGDITPVATHARIINAILITPMRILFLVLLVGTTLEVLANEGRRVFRDARWRKRMRNHIVVVGYGTKGRAAVKTLEKNNCNPAQVVIIDGRPSAISDANIGGYAAIEGDATRRDILRRAEISKAREVIITLDRDDSAILVTLTVRQLNPSAHVVVAVREQDNATLIRQSGADAVVTSSDAVGRLLGLSAVSPNLGTVIEDLLSSGDGLEVSERQVTADEVGKSPGEVMGERVVAVVRNKTLRRFYDPTVARLETGDQLVVVRRSDQAAAPLPSGGERREFGGRRGR
ncbi:potassium channel family protein [Microlunatus panaciterrae]|uniref:Voltage-gated potassium channel n=2 Tax=Microlunatus panaciterrae TaxID=400768 RepID=A0ABS2RF21_9ACTN|nr:potassium channel family protein [Microlunatus panaciterrae]MBM7797283.1 voltage-gated potassium channel [Microlunatus panaciterrae]